MIQQPRTNFSFQTFLSRTWKRSTSGIHKSGGEGSRLSIYIPGNNEGYGPLSKGIIDQPSCNRDEWSCYFTICLRAALKRARALDPRATVISNTAPVWRLPPLLISAAKKSLVADSDRILIVSLTHSVPRCFRDRHSTILPRRTWCTPWLQNLLPGIFDLSPFVHFVASLSVWAKSNCVLCACVNFSREAINNIQWNMSERWLTER